jgi:ribosomal protein S18 acetylase RimI-like enzyme
MESAFKIRQAKVEDVSQIVGIWNQLMELHAGLDALFQRCEGAEGMFAEFVRTNIADDSKVVIVAESDRVVIGYCQGMLEQHPPALEKRDYGYIMDMAVDTRHQREGAGEAMVRKVCRWFKEKGINRVEVRYHVKNKISSGFWPKMGFEVFSKRGFMEI